MTDLIFFSAHAQIARLWRMIGAASRTIGLIARDVRNSSVPASSHYTLRVVTISSGPHTKAALRTAALHEDWHLLLAFSSEDARKLLRRLAVDILVYDYDTGGGDWRKLCSECVDRRVAFQMIARDPSDDLFLEAIGAGGFGILWKPLTSEKLISAIHLARSCAEAHLARAGHAQIHN